MANRGLLNRFGVVLLSGLLVLLSGCATTNDYSDPRDPIEGFNRAMYEFNDALDRAIVKPLAEGYKAIMPTPIDKGITNFFGNLADVGSAINNLLQFKLKRAASDVGRVLVNSTLGILGFIDVASNMNLDKYGEDFDQTLGVWGAGPGPYIVLPILGSTSGRGIFGIVVDWYTDPVRYVKPNRWRNGLIVLRGIDKRADLLGASRVLEEAALDPYEFSRDAYLQKRRSDVYDGNPPPEDFEE
ncbi:MlaA family lipoprotein [Solemya velesiana gill symbiont]|uniref:ABC transporter n=1 Tax=Solemya velesiana gill symbiont TaxID=1918948 RepID=A0A1T2KTX8_9GAMM|nr:VacJ family lipoprotein [Solemya velesiana gill symbiont]OOZ36309.1 ABC transporter [Solemya velesiana gill symbiont]